MELSICPYTLLFHHPFGTAHGLRSGTEALFIRLTHKGLYGYGEVTLPPYLKIRRNNILDEIKTSGIEWLMQLSDGPLEPFEALPGYALSPPLAAGLSMAYYDLISKEKQVSISKLLQVPQKCSAKAMVTLGIGDPEEIGNKLAELPGTEVLKLKMGGPDDLRTIQTVKAQDDRKLFLDANQGMLSVDAMLGLVDAVGPERLVGIEQPFAVDRIDLQRELMRHVSVPVYADESFQGASDLNRVEGLFSGVNLKLMKCGALGATARIAEEADRRGLKVMLGSMSESSLGSGAMAHLGGSAQLGDLDGPWLIKNDPFTGLEIQGGCYQVAGDQGIGVDLKADLKWSPIGA